MQPMQPQQEQFGAPPQQVYAEQPQMMQPEMMQQPGVFPVPLPPCWLPSPAENSRGCRSILPHH
jgi:hypothetical protein